MMREVRFNSALVHDDGLLAGSFARKYRVPFAEGREIAPQEHRILRRTMASDGEVTIGRIRYNQLGIPTRSVLFPCMEPTTRQRTWGITLFHGSGLLLIDAMTDVIADNTSKERIRYRIRVRESRGLIRAAITTP